LMCKLTYACVLAACCCEMLSLKEFACSAIQEYDIICMYPLYTMPLSLAHDATVLSRLPWIKRLLHGRGQGLHQANRSLLVLGHPLRYPMRRRGPLHDCSLQHEVVRRTQVKPSSLDDDLNCVVFAVVNEITLSQVELFIPTRNGSL
jgi:hypothetical protein